MPQPKMTPREYAKELLLAYDGDENAVVGALIDYRSSSQLPVQYVVDTMIELSAANREIMAGG